MNFLQCQINMLQCSDLSVLLEVNTGLLNPGGEITCDGVLEAELRPGISKVQCADVLAL